MTIKTVKIRFNRYICETDKAYCLEYRRRKLWIPKKICWDLSVAGNDLHAWAILPTWKAEEIIGNNIEDLYNAYGERDLRERFSCQIGTVIEHHKPDKLTPKEDNTITDLRK